MLTRHLHRCRTRGEAHPAFAAPPAAPPQGDPIVYPKTLNAPKTHLFPARDTQRVRNWLERMGLAIARDDAGAYDHARRELKKLGLNVSRQMAGGEGRAAG